MPPMAADFIGQVQACLREAAMTSSDTVDETLSGVTGAFALVRVNTQLWLAEMHGIPPTFHWVQVKVVGRKCQGLVPLECVRPSYTKVRAPLKHLFAAMTAQMQRICGKRPKTNHPSPAQAPEPSPSTPCALAHAPAQVSEPSPPPSPPLEHASAPVTEPSPVSPKFQVPCSVFVHREVFARFFFAHFFCSALCHPRACAAVSASHSDQLLRTLHSTLPLLHYMLIFCSFCSFGCLPSQSQHSDSLLKLCLEALFGAQSRVALPRRGCFQAQLCP